MQFTPEQLADLYPGKIFLMQRPAVEPVAWKLKPGSKALFVLHEDEFRNKTLTDLLRKIVMSINLPTEMAGFGVIRKGMTEVDFSAFPCSLAVVFDDTLPGAGAGKRTEGENTVYFTKRLAQLSSSDADKRQLWQNLKEIKSQLGL